jgi:uncharacterized protein (TIGR00725 family)
VTEQPVTQEPVTKLYVAVVGAGDAGGAELELAEAVGRAVAEAGAVVVCGGLGGVMEAACRGAKERGGVTVGILPTTRRRDANAYVDVAIPTGLGEARNAVVVRSADAVIAVGGEFGTLSEIALALKAGLPVVGLGSWELAKNGVPVPGVVPASGPVEAVVEAIRRAGRH